MTRPLNFGAPFCAFLERRARKLGSEDRDLGEAALACCQQLRNSGRVQLQRLDERLQKAARSFLTGLDPQLKTDRFMRRAPADVEQFQAWAPQLSSRSPRGNWRANPCPRCCASA